MNTFMQMNKTALLLIHICLQGVQACIRAATVGINLTERVLAYVV